MSVKSARLRDAAFGLATMAVAGAFLQQTTAIRRTPFDTLGSAYFPRIVSVALLLLGTILLLRAILGRLTADTDVVLFAGSKGGYDRWPLAFGMLVLTASYAVVLATTTIDFFIMTTGYLTAAGWLLAGGGRSRFLQAALFGLAFGGFTTVIFKTVLGVALP